MGLIVIYLTYRRTNKVSTSSRVILSFKESHNYIYYKYPMYKINVLT